MLLHNLSPVAWRSRKVATGTQTGAGYGRSLILDRAPKRLFDLSVALSCLFLLLPLFVLVAFLVWAVDRKSPFYSHLRLGRGGKTFGCLKFRSMRMNGDEILRRHLAENPAAMAEWTQNRKLKNDPRITIIGHVLRKTSLDELPQLWNVVRGDMSLVGPRPIVVGEISRYGRYFEHYCAVRPGITGLWQVGGRNDVSYRRRVAYDVTYSRARSCAMNVKIIAYTVPSVLFQRGSY